MVSFTSKPTKIETWKQKCRKTLYMSVEILKVATLTNFLLYCTMQEKILSMNVQLSSRAEILEVGRMAE